MGKGNIFLSGIFPPEENEKRYKAWLTCLEKPLFHILILQLSDMI